MEKNIFNTIKNRDLIKEDNTIEYSPETLMVAQTLELIATYIKDYDCDVQDCFFVLNYAPPSEMNQLTSDFIRARSMADSENLKNLSNKPQIPSTKVKGSISGSAPSGSFSGAILLPGWKPPTRLNPPVVRVVNPTLPKDSKKPFLFDFLSKILCGKLDLSFNKPKPPPNCEINLPDFNLSADITINVDECLAKFLPPIFDSLQSHRVLEFFGGLGKGVYGGALGSSFDFGNVAGDLIPKDGALGKLADGVKAAAGVCSDAIGSCLDAVDKMYDAANKALGDASGFPSDTIAKGTSLSGIAGAASTAVSAGKAVASALAPIASTIGAAGLVVGGGAVFTNELLKAQKNGGLNLNSAMGALKNANNSISGAFSQTLNINSGLTPGGNIIPEALAKAMNDVSGKINNTAEKMGKLKGALDKVKGGKIPC